MTSLGTMTRFYRNQAVLNEFFAIGGLERGGGLMAPPAYLLDETLDFPYKSRSDGKEILFADHLTVVRFLGGINDERIANREERESADLVERDDNDCIHYRFDRLDWFSPFVDRYGPELTLVLDNIPWAFCAKANIDGYGQSAPPADYEQWAAFITALCEELVRRYGFETVNAWRFRLATEARLETDTAGFIRHYKATVGAVRGVLPGARFSYYNTAGVHAAASQHINPYEAIETVVAAGLPVDFAPVSYYSVPRYPQDLPAKDRAASGRHDGCKVSPWSVSPVLRAEREYPEHWRLIDEAAGRRLPREIQELGVLVSECGVRTSEPGARGAAWLLQLLLTMRAESDIQRAWHWHTVDMVQVPEKAAEQQSRLLRSNGWLYSILDHTIGGELVLLDVQSDQSDEPRFSRRAAAILGADNGRSYLLLSSFNIERDEPRSEQVAVRIPVSELADPVALRATWLTDETDVYRAVRNDLAERGQLEQAFLDKPNVLSTVCGINQPTDGMATPEGLAFVDRNFPAYAAIIQDSLRLKPFPGAVEQDGSDWILSMTMTTPSTVAVTWR
ncbi:MAG: hypothetical protein HN742_25725 [Lentisphaerae bacterium]|jgi:hypothetical protein|nr:hypothetical protein [Lentisphaerota bacterium]MBT4814416.1 hypothetical protein [Lentisphaerota bacterium]MBT5608022.1 hypothetical protein [Lentisphaerota bacterium]MBT7056026.1 hypothetical protein [Lentisphaerota bacterium]MBT7845300.1 hypothetical protein [Lentisphaerota bacterium]